MSSETQTRRAKGTYGMVLRRTGKTNEFSAEVQRNGQTVKRVTFVSTSTAPAYYNDPIAKLSRSKKE